MSLFAAYAEQAKELQVGEDVADKPEWLENSSFKPDLAITNRNIEDAEIVPDSNSESFGSDYEAPKVKKKKKEKKKKRHRREDTLEDKEDDKAEGDLDRDKFTLDKKETREYLTVKTISRPAVAKYHTKYYLTFSRTKKHKFRRYFKVSKYKENQKDYDEGKEEKLTKQNLDKVGFGERDQNFTGFSQEEDLSKMTAFYNKSLAESPQDIEMWLKYVEFQDTVYQFEKSYRKGSIAKAQRVLAERKISILDKALMLNSGCEALLRERLKVAVSAFPADELQSQLKKLLEKEKHNIILWQGYIEATQCSMSHCNSPAVLSLYGKCLSTLHQLRRSTSSEKYVFEENILRMLYQCGLFLKQAGLFEQLWTLLKMYLELNLSPTDKERFNIGRYVDEKELLELEEVVLNSQLPHHELWLRTEKLRESCHWLPFAGDQNCEDPQRVVFNEDVVELIHPITMPENIFKLVATTLTLLKVPLLPCRHSTVQDLGLDYVPWSLDSVEALLPVFMCLYPIDTSNENLLKDTQRLAVGPQYLKALPGQEEYLHFILSVMESCAECLKDQDRTAVRVWWFRFQRLLIVLGNQGRFKLTPHLKKKIKTSIKDLLKREEYRNDEIFYIEYALIEKAFGNAEQCINVLKTALSMNKNTSVATENWTRSQANQCCLYRSLVEATMELENGSEDLKKMILNLLVRLVLQRNFETLTNGLIMEAETKFKTITKELMDTELQCLVSVDHFLPDFFTDWVICNGWFLFWSKEIHYFSAEGEESTIRSMGDNLLLPVQGPLQCSTFLEEILLKLEGKVNSLAFQKEVLYEFWCAALFKYCMEHPGSGAFKVLDVILFRAIEKFPNNLYLLAILAKEQTVTQNMGISSWKLQHLLLKSGRSMSTLFTVTINDLMKLEIERETTDSITGNKVELGIGFKNKMLSLYRKITKSDMCTRRCGLVWRLYLQFVHTYCDPQVCRDVYYRAVEECPWLKALYMDAAIYIPAELAQIQDLIIEKQLRLHVTPEELDILRS